jgi:hypothetical protein
LSTGTDSSALSCEGSWTYFFGKLEKEFGTFPTTYSFDNVEHTTNVRSYEKQ